MAWWQALGRYVNIWDRLDNIEEGMTKMASDLDTINDDMTALSSGLDAIDTELTAISGALDAEQARVGQAVDLSAIRARLDGLRDHVATVAGQATSLADRASNVGQAPGGTPAPATADTSTAADPAPGTSTTTA